METVRVDIDEIKVGTYKAFLVVVNGQEYWIPKSQVKDYEGPVYDPTVVYIPEWLAEEKGLL